MVFPYNKRNPDGDPDALDITIFLSHKYRSVLVAKLLQF